MTIEKFTKTPKPDVRFKAGKNGDAEIILYGDVGFDITAKEFSRELKALGDVKTINVRITSWGGDVFEGLAIYSRLVDSGATINVSIDGEAASIASVIAMAGDTIRITQAGTIMIHDAWALAAGNATKLRGVADRLEAASARIAGIYQRRTGNEMDKIREWMEVETEFDADTAVKMGFATEVFAAERIAASFNRDRHHFEHTPTVLMPVRRASAETLVIQQRMYTAR